MAHGTKRKQLGHGGVTGKPAPAAYAVFTWPVRVYYEDTDAGGVVYHANYLKYMERARTEWLRNLGYEQDDLRRRFGVLFVVTGVTLDYHKPARFNDALLVSVKILHRRRASLTFAQDIQRLGAEQARLCSAEISVVCVDRTSFKPQPWPREIAAELQ